MNEELWSGIVDVNAPALVTVGVTHTWRDVTTHVQTPPHIDRHLHARHDRVGVVGETSAGLALALTAMVHHGLTPVLGHPRWPLALRAAAFARAGVGGPRPASWRPWIDDADSGTVVFTSGSTGVPKAVLHSVAAHRENAAGAHAVMPFGPGDRWLVSLPLCHVGGLALVFRALHAGGALAFILWVWALQRATPTRVATTMAVNPIAAGLLAAQLVGEPFTLDLVAGLVVVVAGIAVATSGKT